VIAQRQALENTAKEWVQESAGLLSGRRGALREFGVVRAMSSGRMAMSEVAYRASCEV
jgi:hypothetical protein